MKITETINVSKKEKTSITSDIGELLLSNYNIFAGNNNAGKTHLLNVIQEELEKIGMHVIHIPAERVIAKKEIDTNTQQDPMRKAIIELTDVIFDVDKSITTRINDIKELLPEMFNKYGVEKTLLNINLKETSSSEYKKQIKDIYAKNLIESITIKDEYSNEDGIDISKVGQGTQRLLVVSLIEYLAEKKRAPDSKRTCLIFEEPEAFMHPTLKKKIYDNLITLSENTMVVVSTHDPYFIDLGRDNKLFEVRRDPSKEFSTQVFGIEKDVLPYKSSAEINYIVFKQSSPTYFIELYEYKKGLTEDKLGKLLKYFEFDLELSSAIKEPQKDKDSNGKDVTFITRIRHDLAHPAVSTLDSFETGGEDAIRKLRDYII